MPAVELKAVARIRRYEADDRHRPQTRPWIERTQPNRLSARGRKHSNVGSPLPYMCAANAYLKTLAPRQGTNTNAYSATTQTHQPDSRLRRPPLGHVGVGSRTRGVGFRRRISSGSGRLAGWWSVGGRHQLPEASYASGVFRVDDFNAERRGSSHPDSIFYLFAALEWCVGAKGSDDGRDCRRCKAG